MTIPHTKTKIPNPDLTREKGKRDGKDTAQLMHAAEFPKWSVVYLDLEEGILSDRRLSGLRPGLEGFRGRGRLLSGHLLHGQCAPLVTGACEGRLACAATKCRPERKHRSSGGRSRSLACGLAQTKHDCDPGAFRGGVPGLGSASRRRPCTEFYDLSYCAVADPSDLASVDEALRILPGSKPRDEEAVA